MELSPKQTTFNNKMHLRFDAKQIEAIADRYIITTEENELMQLNKEIHQTKIIDKDQLTLAASWKSKRILKHIKKNSQDFVEEITSFALSTHNEQARIEVLTLLKGVAWPTASALLHLFHNDPYPILDFRALWSVNLEQQSQYNFSFWKSYVDFCRDMANGYGVSMRTLDRALWQYSKENQPSINLS